ncbi:MAG: TetR/AcrR family transcriptional regulator [Ancrocorticia sp.]
MPPKKNLKRDPEGTRKAIMDAALEEFARFGFSGSRIDAIAEATNTSKRMIYYYFENKLGLHIAVVNDAIATMSSFVDKVPQGIEDPLLNFAVHIDVAVTWSEENPGGLRLLTSENKYPDGSSEAIESINIEINKSILKSFGEPFARCVEAGLFRTGPDAPTVMSVYQCGLAISLFRIEHNSTMNTTFGVPTFAEMTRDEQHRIIIDVLLRYVLKDTSQVSEYIDKAMAISRPAENPQWPQP